MKIHLLRSCVLILFALVLAGSTPPPSQTEVANVSLIQLIANPSAYDGKTVQIIGYLRLEFEGNAIYLHEEDYKHAINKNGIWVKVSSEMINKKQELDQHYVILEGKFNAKMSGHMDLWSGSIENISRAQVWVQR
jgi:hypothetical protein